MRRFGSVIKVRPERLEEYRQLHAAVWPEVLQTITDCNMRNYSIFYRDGYLVAYFEYVGENYEADMARMAADPVTQKWWQATAPCQEPVDSSVAGEWWAEMAEVFHVD